jgi:type II secretory pathway pseudopilin PulG
MNHFHVCRHQSRSHSRTAFTLLEITLVIGLVVLLAGGVFGFLFDLLTTRERLAIESTRARDASRLLDMIEHGTMTTAVGHGWGPGVVGSDDSLTLASMVLSLDNDGLAPTRVVRLSYNDDAQAITADVTSERGGSGRGERVELVTGVERLRFRYLDGRMWTESFDSQRRGALPRAIEVAVWFDRTRAEPQVDELGGLDPSGAGSGFDVEALRSIADEQAMFAEDENEPLREPDRYRIIAIPDAEAMGASSVPGRIPSGSGAP